MHRLRWAGAALVVALLGACTEDDPEPKVDPTPSASDSTSPVTASTSPTATPTSPTATPTSPSTDPRQAVDAWFAAFSVALQSGMTDQVTALSSPDCESCARLVSKIQDLYGKGGRLETDGWRATRVNEAPDSASKRPIFVMQVVQARQILLNQKGEVVDETAKMTVPMRMTFNSASDGWVLTRLEILQ